MTILIQPHDDDAFLFACFTLLREKPLVVTVFDSYVQNNRGLPITAAQRWTETRNACALMGLTDLRLGFRDDDPNVTSDQIRSRFIDRMREHGNTDNRMYLPAAEINGHPQHDLVARSFLVDSSRRYLTYTTAGKSKSPREVAFEPAWIGLKLRALACFTSQFDPRTGCAEHFIGRSLREYAL